MRQKLLLYRSVDESQKNILEEAVANLSKTSGTNTITHDDMSQEIDEFYLYDTLFEEYVGNSRKDYLSSLLDKDTYIITLNGNVDMVYGVLKRINPKFDKSRIYSVRETFEHFQNKQIQIDKIEMAATIKISKILDILKEGERSLFVDDMFSEELIEHLKTKTMNALPSDHKKYKMLEILEYFFVDKEIMNGLEKEYIDEKKIDITKYNKIFLDFDDTITKETDSTPIINDREYTYGHFLNLSLQ